MPFLFDNSYSRLPDAFFSLIKPTPVSGPVMIQLNHELATELGIDIARLNSPEGLAIDQKGERLWIINDPDSVKGNYRFRGAKKASGPYALYTPLLFELKLSDLFPGQTGK